MFILTPNEDPEPILNYLDLLARLRGLSNVAGDFQKSLKKAQMPNIEEQAQGNVLAITNSKTLVKFKNTGKQWPCPVLTCQIFSQR